MHLSKHKQHRNQKYLAWLRTKNCIVSGKKAECAHHIRLGTNGGTSLKPSDYFCIPLLNEFHTTGVNALHIVGEETFLKQFSIEPISVFAGYLKDYLKEIYEISYSLENQELQTSIFEMITIIENKITRLPSKKTTKKKVATSLRPKTSITENSYYQAAKKLKNERNKELRKQIKEERDSATRPKQQFKGNEFYEKAKEAKRLKDRELRRQLKEKSRKKD